MLSLVLNDLQNRMSEITEWSSKKKKRAYLSKVILKWSLDIWFYGSKVILGYKQFHITDFMVMRNVTAF